MYNLTPRQKEIVIELVLAKYKKITFRSGHLSKRLKADLSSPETTQAEKWEKVEEYLDKILLSPAVKQKKRKLFVLFQQEIAAFEVEEDEDELTVGKYNAVELIYLARVTKVNIINKLIAALDILKANGHSVELVRDVFLEPAKSKSLDEKWDALLKYCRNTSNHQQPIYLLLLKIVKAHNMTEEHWVHVRSSIDKIRQMNQDEMLGEKHSKLEYHTLYNHIISSLDNLSDDAITPQSLLLKAHYQRLLNDNPLSKLEENVDTATSWRSAKKYSGHVFANSAKRGLQVCTTPGIMMFKGIKQLVTKGTPGMAVAGVCVSVPVAAVAVPVTLLGGLVGGIAGSISGLARSKTRHPIDVVDQKQLIEKLEASLDPEEKGKEWREKSIERICNDYKMAKSRVGSSHASKNLIHELKRKDLDTDQKWLTLRRYMLRGDKAYLYNNGKKLFEIIYRVVLRGENQASAVEAIRAERNLRVQSRSDDLFDERAPAAGSREARDRLVKLVGDRPRRAPTGRR